MARIIIVAESTAEARTMAFLPGREVLFEALKRELELMASTAWPHGAPYLAFDLVDEDWEETREAVRKWDVEAWKARRAAERARAG